MYYVTEQVLYETARRSLADKVKAEQDQRRQDEEAGRTPAPSRFSMALFDTPQYRQWVESRIADARRDKRLVTARQYADLQERRRLRVGDPVRFIGEDRLEQSQSGRTYLRKNGEVGHIVETEKMSDGFSIVTYMPKVPDSARSEFGPSVFAVQFQAKEFTPGYFLLERITPDEAKAIDMTSELETSEEDLPEELRA